MARIAQIAQMAQIRAADSKDCGGSREGGKDLSAQSANPICMVYDLRGATSSLGTRLSKISQLWALSVSAVTGETVIGAWGPRGRCCTEHMEQAVGSTAHSSQCCLNLIFISFLSSNGEVVWRHECTGWGGCTIRSCGEPDLGEAQLLRCKGPRL
jgi:hypothetical protein